MAIILRKFVIYYSCWNAERMKNEHHVTHLMERKSKTRNQARIVHKHNPNRKRINIMYYVRVKKDFGNKYSSQERQKQHDHKYKKKLNAQHTIA